MAKRVAKFEKVTYGQFEKDWLDTFDIPELDTSTRREIESIYGAITLPKRATKGSAGYDFVSPLTFTLKPGEKVLVLDNNKFRWYINLGNDYDKNSDIYLDTQVEGRKNNYSAQILSNDDSLSSVHSSTGSYR